MKEDNFRNDSRSSMKGVLYNSVKVQMSNIVLLSMPLEIFIILIIITIFIIIPISLLMGTKVYNI